MISSGAHKGNPINMADLQWTQRPYFFGSAYGESKTANILFAQEVSRRWGGEGIWANAVLPGSALTGLQRYHGEELKRQIGFIKEDGGLGDMVKIPEQAAATSVWAATSPELSGKGGLVLEDCGIAHIAGPDSHPWMGFDTSVANPETARDLWDHSLQLLHRPEMRASHDILHIMSEKW